MTTYDLKLGELDLELRFDNTATRKIEKALGGRNIMTVFDTTDSGLPKAPTDDFLAVIYGANKSRPSYNLNQITKAYDEQTELKPFDIFFMLMEWFEESGLFPNMAE